MADRPIPLSPPNFKLPFPPAEAHKFASRAPDDAPSLDTEEKPVELGQRIVPRPTTEEMVAEIVGGRAPALGSDPLETEAEAFGWLHRFWGPW